jgi:hypothetical protein
MAGCCKEKEGGVEQMTPQELKQMARENYPGHTFPIEDRIDENALAKLQIQAFIDGARAYRESMKQEIIDAYSNGWHDGQDVIINSIQHVDKGGDEAGEKYFNNL